MTLLLYIDIFFRLKESNRNHNIIKLELVLHTGRSTCNMYNVFLQLLPILVCISNTQYNDTCHKLTTCKSIIVYIHTSSLIVCNFHFCFNLQLQSINLKFDTRYNLQQSLQYSLEYSPLKQFYNNSSQSESGIINQLTCRDIFLQLRFFGSRWRSVPFDRHVAIRIVHT